MPFSLVNRVFHQACHTRITDSTGLIVCRGLPKTQEKSSTSLPFSPKSCTKVTNVTFPGSRGKRHRSRNSMRDDGKAASSVSGATPAHSRVPAQAPAFHRRHANLRNKLFRIFRTLSDGKSNPLQQEISNLDSRIIRMGRHRKRRACYTSHCTPLIYIYQTFVLVYRTFVW